MKTRRQIPLLPKVLSLYIVAFGIVSAINIGYSQFVSTQVAKTIATQQTAHAAKPKVKRPLEITGQPVQLDIPRLGIHLAVRDGEYDYQTGQWALSDDAAQFATLTKQPNDTAGNTLIYGHNTDQVFWPTKDLVSGDELIVTTSNNHRFHYRYTKDSLVAPDDTTILTATSDKPQLTLLTCNGWFSEQRRLMYFDFTEVSS